MEQRRQNDWQGGRLNKCKHPKFVKRFKMATLIKLKKVPVKTSSLTKVHSLVKALGAVKEKGFSIVIKSRKELWER